MGGQITAYVVALLVFGIVDAAWLYVMGAQLYRPVLGDILASDVRLAPAVAFYLLFPLGLVIFAVDPALRANSLSHAVIYGALFGLFTYATYDLTNFATLRNWTLQITLIDIAYGTVLAAFSAAIAYKVASGLFR